MIICVDNLTLISPNPDTLIWLPMDISFAGMPQFQTPYDQGRTEPVSTPS